VVTDFVVAHRDHLLVTFFSHALGGVPCRLPNPGQPVGGAVVHPAEVLVFLVALGGWWRNWRNIAWSFALALVGTMQVFTVGDLGDPDDAWVHGLHGGLVLFVIGFAAYIAHREARALGLLRP
jgi:hypothetical protein